MFEVVAGLVFVSETESNSFFLQPHCSFVRGPPLSVPAPLTGGNWRCNWTNQVQEGLADGRQTVIVSVLAVPLELDPYFVAAVAR